MADEEEDVDFKSVDGDSCKSDDGSKVVSDPAPDAGVDTPEAVGDVEAPIVDPASRGDVEAPIVENDGSKVVSDPAPDAGVGAPEAVGDTASHGDVEAPIAVTIEAAGADNLGDPVPRDDNTPAPTGQRLNLEEFAGANHDEVVLVQQRLDLLADNRKLHARRPRARNVEPFECWDLFGDTAPQEQGDTAPHKQGDAAPHADKTHRNPMRNEAEWGQPRADVEHFCHVRGWPITRNAYPAQFWEELTAEAQSTGNHVSFKGRGGDKDRSVTIKGTLHCQALFRKLVKTTVDIWGPELFADTPLPEYSIPPGLRTRRPKKAPEPVQRQEAAHGWAPVASEEGGRWSDAVHWGANWSDAVHWSNKESQWPDRWWEAWDTFRWQKAPSQESQWPDRWWEGCDTVRWLPAPSQESQWPDRW